MQLLEITLVNEEWSGNKLLLAISDIWVIWFHALIQFFKNEISWIKPKQVITEYLFIRYMFSWIIATFRLYLHPGFSGQAVWLMIQCSTITLWMIFHRDATEHKSKMANKYKSHNLYFNESENPDIGNHLENNNDGKHCMFSYFSVFDELWL